jgi:hypothetical protein
VFYECQIGMIPQACDYYDLYYALTQSAINLNLSWSERVNIKEACEAVEICPADALDDWALTGHWKLDDGSGNIATDSSGFGNHGALYNGPIWTGGKIGGALDFDGSNDYVSLAPISALTGSAITVSAWVRPSSSINAEFSPILTQCIVQNNNYSGYYLCLAGYCPTFFLHMDGVVSEIEVEADVWHHVAGTYDNNELKIYVNGITNHWPLREKQGVGTSAFIGWDGDGAENYYFKGLIDDVRVYNYALDIGEIWDLVFYNTTKLFCVKNSSGVAVAWVDNLGNLFLKGTKQTVWQDPSGQTDEFIIKGSDGVPMAYINDSGNLFLQGTFSEGQTPVPSDDADEFRVQDSTGADVAIIDTTNGSITIKGKLYQQNP